MFEDHRSELLGRVGDRIIAYEQRFENSYAVKLGSAALDIALVEMNVNLLTAHAIDELEERDAPVCKAVWLKRDNWCWHFSLFFFGRAFIASALAAHRSHRRLAAVFAESAEVAEQLEQAAVESLVSSFSSWPLDRPSISALQFGYHFQVLQFVALFLFSGVELHQKPPVFLRAKRFGIR